MYHRLAKVMLGVVAVGTLPVSTWAQAPAAPAAPAAAAAEASPYSSQDEGDIATAAGKETDPQKKLDKLKEWEQKYPNATLKNQRTLLQAQALLQIATSGFSKTTPDDAVQKAAQQLADNMDTYFAPAVKPAGVTDDQWVGIKKTAGIQVHSALGWNAMQKHDDATAEAEMKKVLAIDGNQAQVSYWLGSVILRQKKIERYSEALYDFAHAVTVTGPSAMPPAGVTAGDAYLKRAYVNYHGDATGLDELKKTASGAAMPPAEFHIKSVTDIDKEKQGDEEAYNKAHPDIALWRLIRTTLQSDTGATYFTSVKGSQIPPPEVKVFKGKVVSVADKDIIVNVDSPVGDATLRFEKALNAKVIEAGTAVEFKGVVDSFTKEPYMLVLTIDDPKTDVTGLPATAFGAGAAAPKRPAPRRPAAATHKK